MGLHDVADFFLLSSLKREIEVHFNDYNARKSVRLQRSDITKHISHIDDIIYDLRAAYNQDTPSGKAFQDLMNSFIHGVRYQFFRCPAFIDLLSEIPRLGSNLLKDMIQCGDFTLLAYPDSCSKCHACKSGGEYCTHTILHQSSKLYASCRNCVSLENLSSPRTDWQDRWNFWNIP